MKVRVKLFGFPDLALDLAGGKEIQITFAGDTVKDLLKDLSSTAEAKYKGFFLNAQGEVSETLFIWINGQPIVQSNLLSQQLRENDFVELIFASGG